MPKGNYSSFIGGNRLGSSPDKKKKQKENFFEIKPNDTRKTMQNINAVLGDDCDENFDIDDDEPPSVVTINKTQTKDSYPIMNNVSL